MDITQRLAQWAENDMRFESVALEAKYEIELLRKQFNLSRDLGMKWMDEIERLREALKKIGDGDECIRLLVYPSRCKRAYDARTALKGDE